MVGAFLALFLELKYDVWQWDIVPILYEFATKSTFFSIYFLVYIVKNVEFFKNGLSETEETKPSINTAGSKEYIKRRSAESAKFVFLPKMLRLGRPSTKLKLLGWFFIVS